MLIPLGLEKAERNRVPWITIILAGFCTGVFLASRTIPVVHQEDVEKASREIAAFWAENPYLSLPEACQPFERLVPRPSVDPAAQPNLGGRKLVEEHFKTLCQHAAPALSDATGRKWGLLPQRGWRDASVFTHLLVHSGWESLLINVLFLLFCVSLLEILYGVVVFPLFLVLVGAGSGVILSSALQEATLPIQGLAGAVAGCMGAFALRLPVQRVKWAIWPFISWSFAVPAWLLLLVWLGAEVASLKWVPGTSSGMLMAHGMTLGLGMALALLVKLVGLERKGVLSRLQLEVSTRVRLDLAEAEASMRDKKWVPARIAFHHALETDPHCMQAMWGVARASAALGDNAALNRDVDRLFYECISIRDIDTLKLALQEFESKVDMTTMRAATRYGLARNVYDTTDIKRAIVLYEGAAQDPKWTVSAYLRLAEVCVADKRPDMAVAYAQKVLDHPRVSEEMMRRAKDLLQQGQTLLQAWSDLGIVDITSAAAKPGQAAAPGAPSNTRVTNCRFTGRTADGYQLESVEGGTTLMFPHELITLGLARVPLVVNTAVPPQPMLVVDMVLRDDAAATGRSVLRLRSDQLGMGSLFPGMRSGEALKILLADLVQKSGVTVWPSAEVLQTGTYPLFGDLRSFEIAMHGRPLEGSTMHAAFSIERPT